MMQTVHVRPPMVGSSLMSPPVVQRNQGTCSGLSFTQRPRSLTVCQLDSDKFNSSAAESSRRNFMIGTTVSLTTATTAVGFIPQPGCAQAAKRKPPPPEDKKPEEEKFVSGYEAKLLANLRRKEELKELVEAQKKKAKSVLQPPEENQFDIFGQVVN